MIENTYKDSIVRSPNPESSAVNIKLDIIKVYLKKNFLLLNFIDIK